MTIPRVTKFSTHEIFHPRIFSQLLRIWLRESRNLKPRKLILKTRDSFSRKFAPPEITRYTVQHSTVLQYTEVLYYTVLYCSVLYSLHCIVLYLYCTVLYCTALYCIVLYCTILYYTCTLYIPLSERYTRGRPQTGSQQR